MTATTAATTAGYPARTLEFTYDCLGRRVQKRVINTSASPATDTRHRYLYDGWNQVAEYETTLSPLTLTLTRSYTWGLDLTGSRTAAGGVGALVQIHDHATAKTYLPTYDGSGNVAALLDADAIDATVAATYEYDPYGQPLRQAGTYAAANPFRFSTKFTDSETALVYHETRFYSPNLGRFISRDSIGEEGGLNLYAYVSNRVPNAFDRLGMGPNDNIGDDGIGSYLWNILFGSPFSDPLPSIGLSQSAVLNVTNSTLLPAYDQTATNVQTLVNDPQVLAVTKGSSLILGSAATVVMLPTLPTGATVVVLSFGAVVAFDIGMAYIGSAFMPNTAELMTTLDQVPTGLFGTVGFIGTQATGNPAYQQFGSAGDSLISYTATLTNNPSLVDTYSLISDASDAANGIADGFMSLSESGPLLSTASGYQTTTMSHSQAVTSNIGLSNVISVTVNSETGQVTIVTNGKPKSTGPEDDTGAVLPENWLWAETIGWQLMK